MIAARPDLLVIGGLTVDRFADGSSAPGGSVLHIARAAAPRGMRVAIMTVVGREPEARAGLEELRRLAARVDCAESDATATFRHRESPAGRRLWLEREGGAVRFAHLGSHDAPGAILVAPVADEVVIEELERLPPGPPRGAILQGFLRSVIGDGEVRPLALSALAPGQVAALSRFDVLVASREDLAAEGPEPSDQLVALRRCFGPRPAIIVTDGPNGVWTGHAHLPVPRLVTGVSSVGAGDIFAAFLLAPDWPRPATGALVHERSERAMQVVVDALMDRRG